MQRPMHPYELGRTLRDHGDDRSIKFNHGSLYMVVQQLEKAGFIAEQETSREGQRPERTVYALTDAGPRRAARLAARPASANRSTSTRLRGGAVADQRAAAQRGAAAAAPPAGPARRTRAEIRASDRQRARPGRTRLFLVEEQYRLAMLDAESSFVDRVHRPDHRPGHRLGPDVGAVPRRDRRPHRTTRRKGK